MPNRVSDQSDSPPPPNSVAEFPDRGTFPQQALLWVTLVCILATLLTTWPLWQFRGQPELPPNVPVLGFLRHLPAIWLMIAGLVVTLFRPKLGFGLFAACYVVSVGADLSRLQPQLFGMLVLLAACIWPVGRKIAFWFLIAMWLWAGVHKIFSPYWMGPTSFTILDRMGIDSARELHIAFAWIVAITEIILALVALMRWRWAWLLCVTVHFGIVGMLLTMNWNFAVLYWNIAIALVGGWLLWQESNEFNCVRNANPMRSRFSPNLLFPSQLGLQIWALLMLIVPAGFYLGWTPHCLSHALYSDNLPKAVITTTGGEASPIDTWQTLYAPVPSERWFFEMYFNEVAEVGDKMHILDSRPNLKDEYVYRLGEDRSTMMTVDEFYSPIIGVGKGRGNELAPAVYQFELIDAKMTRSSKTGPIFSIQIPPEQFRVDLIDFLPGLPNLEILDLSGTDVSNREISKLNRLKNLKIILLNNTNVSDAGIERLNGLKRLELITRKGTEITTDAAVDAIIRNTR